MSKWCLSLTRALYEIPKQLKYVYMVIIPLYKLQICSKILIRFYQQLGDAPGNVFLNAWVTSAPQVACSWYQLSIWLSSTAVSQLLHHFKRAGVLPKALNAHFHSACFSRFFRTVHVCVRLPGGGSESIALRAFIMNVYTRRLARLHSGTPSIHWPYSLMSSVQMAQTFCWSNGFNLARLRLMAQLEPGSAEANDIL